MNEEHTIGSMKMVIMSEEYLVRVMKPADNMSSGELENSLKRNRDMLKESYLAMCQSYRDEVCNRIKKEDIDYLSPTQNALVARANIDLLIPLINVKGGVAAYESKLEALPIEKHIEKLHKKAKENAIKEKSQTRIYGFFMIIVVLILATLLLLLFN